MTKILIPWYDPRLNPYKIDQKVMCINNVKGKMNFTIGKVYKIKDIACSESIGLVNDKGKLSYNLNSKFIPFVKGMKFSKSLKLQWRIL